MITPADIDHIIWLASREKAHSNVRKYVLDLLSKCEGVAVYDHTDTLNNRIEYLNKSYKAYFMMYMRPFKAAYSYQERQDMMLEAYITSLSSLKKGKFFEQAIQDGMKSLNKYCGSTNKDRVLSFGEFTGSTRDDNEYQD